MQRCQLSERAPPGSDRIRGGRQRKQHEAT